jgi:hypothetical protein
LARAEAELLRLAKAEKQLLPRLRLLARAGHRGEVRRLQALQRTLHHRLATAQKQVLCHRRAHRRAMLERGQGLPPAP